MDESKPPTHQNRKQKLTHPPQELPDIHLTRNTCGRGEQQKILNDKMACLLFRVPTNSCNAIRSNWTQFSRKIWVEEIERWFGWAAFLFSIRS